MDHNRIQLVGRLTKAPAYFPPGRRGQEHATFMLAVNRVVPNEDGPAADYFPCSVWGPEAVRFCEQRDKGDEVCVRGRIRTNFVLQANGQRAYFWEVRVEQLHYGRKSLKNLSTPPAQDRATEAVQTLTNEFEAS